MRDRKEDLQQSGVAVTHAAAPGTLAAVVCREASHSPNRYHGMRRWVRRSVPVVLALVALGGALPYIGPVAPAEAQGSARKAARSKSGKKPASKKEQGSQTKPTKPGTPATSPGAAGSAGTAQQNPDRPNPASEPVKEEPYILKDLDTSRLMVLSVQAFDFLAKQLLGHAEAEALMPLVLGIDYSKSFKSQYPAVAARHKQFKKDWYFAIRDGKCKAPFVLSDDAMSACLIKGKSPADIIPVYEAVYDGLVALDAESRKKGNPLLSQAAGNGYSGTLTGAVVLSGKPLDKASGKAAVDAFKRYLDKGYSAYDAAAALAYLELASGASLDKVIEAVTYYVQKCNLNYAVKSVGHTIAAEIASMELIAGLPRDKVVEFWTKMKGLEKDKEHRETYDVVKFWIKFDRNVSRFTIAVALSILHQNELLRAAPPAEAPKPQKPDEGGKAPGDGAAQDSGGHATGARPEADTGESPIGLVRSL
ncbi:MAG: hypothetical protein GX446_03205 [Chthonomonadales bacterium]|nr:hypothetical protein [Chthonomonadales bacterium]